MIVAHRPLALAPLSAPLILVRLVVCLLAAGAAPLHAELAVHGATGDLLTLPERSENQVNITLDGRLDEAAWADLPVIDELTVIEPDTLETPRHRTEFRLFYTEQALYVGMWAEQPRRTQLQRLSGRDNFFNRDSVSVTVDTSGEGLYGYWFSLALGGSQSDGQVAPERRFSRQWDGPWDGMTAQSDDGWSAEYRLPWSMMSMPDTDSGRRMGLYMSRQVGYLDERFAVPALPPTGARFMSALKPLALPGVEPRQQFDWYPYLSGTFDGKRSETDGRAGLDLFWRPSTNLQVSAALNPDFGAVESDDVVINLTATETFFAENRLFFLEGNEIFETTPRSSPGGGGTNLTGTRRTSQLFPRQPTQLLNTRRIGGAPDIDVPPEAEVADVELGRPTELLGAVKITGQAGGLRYGALAAFEDDPELNALYVDPVPGTDGEFVLKGTGREFGVARFLFERSGRGRRSIGYMGTFANKPGYDALVHGVDAHYLSASGRFTADLQLMHSDVRDVKGYGGLLDLSYTPRRGVRHQLAVDALDGQLDISDLGFLRRNDQYGASYSVDFTRSQGLKRLRNRSTTVLLTYWENAAGEATRTGAFLRNRFTFRNQFELRTELNYFPRRWDDLESDGNGSYRLTERWVGDLAFGTDATRVLAFSGRLGARQEELGDWSYRSALGFTYKPNDRVSLDLDLNYQRRHGWLLNRSAREFTTFDADDFQPRMALDVFLAARQQLRLTLQWAAIKARQDEFLLLPVGGGTLQPVPREPGDVDRSFVINRLTTQLRYRWQIAPLSDLFVVYTRGSNVTSSIDDGFDDLFSDALTDPIIDLFVIKLRYRFGR